jgi:cytochrome c biogenesis protein CcdA
MEPHLGRRPVKNSPDASVYSAGPVAHFLQSYVSLIKTSRILACWLWKAMLWLMRRPWMKALQRKSVQVLPSSLRPRAEASMKKQNAFARKYGLTWLTCVIAFFLTTVGLTWTYQAALYTVQSGNLNPPHKMADLLADQR